MSTVLVTGANRGIGLELCRQLSTGGHQIIAACRKSSPDLDSLKLRTVCGVDVSSDEAVQMLDAELGDTQLDLLINNAGILRRESLEELDMDSMLEQFKVNSLGPLRVTATLRHRMSAGAKVAIISSRMGSIADNSSGSRYGYRMSKAAVNIAGVSLARDLKPQGIAVAILHPGWVRTDMTGNTGLVDAKESAAGLIARIEELTLENSGTFWHMNGEILPW
ncbi:MAG TPA: SDR family oxidoreductase [Myxococcales bacterium]|nr:SDR family oxidoreductase [Myxococcales bacterium]HIN86898.1 SDR family oxidoreductase [Myxococcales bacterium]